MRPRRYDRWTEEEVEELKRLAVADARVNTIALMLRRTPIAVRLKASQDGIRLRENILLEQCILHGLAVPLAPRPRRKPEKGDLAVDLRTSLPA